MEPKKAWPFPGSNPALPPLPPADLLPATRWQRLGFECALAAFWFGAGSLLSLALTGYADGWLSRALMLGPYAAFVVLRWVYWIATKRELVPVPARWRLPPEAKRALREREQAENDARDRRSRERWRSVYAIGGYLTWVVVFFGAYAYCIFEYGFLLGVGLGWLPAAITATVAAFLWPLLLFGGLYLSAWLAK